MIGNLLRQMIRHPLRRTIGPARSIAAFGGVVGPVAFASAWIIGGSTKHGYSPVHDAISRLAAIGSSVRPVMTGGFVVFGVGLVAYSTALRDALAGPAWITAAATGLATIAVALAPLDHSSIVDSLHAAFAATGYVTLAATPLLAARPLSRCGHRTLARLGVGIGSVAGLSLVATSTRLPTGLFQRAGLSLGDVWIVVSAIAIATGRLDDETRH